MVNVFKPKIKRKDSWMENDGYNKNKFSCYSVMGCKSSPASVQINKLPNIPKLTDDDAVKSIRYFQLFRFATCMEWLALFTGGIFCFLMSLAVPVSCILYGEVTVLFMERSINMTTSSTPTIFLKYFGGGKILKNASEEENISALYDDSLAFTYSTLVMCSLQLIFGIIGVNLINFAALRQISRIRKMLIHSVLRQDMTWYDTNTDINFSSKIADDIEKMKEGMGEKLGIFVYLVSSFVTSVVIALFYGWKLTLVVLSVAPIVIISTAVVAKLQSTYTTRELQAYEKAGKVAEEVLCNIRTVVAFGGEQKEVERYTDHLKLAQDMGCRKGLYSGLGSGSMWLIVYLSYAMSFYYGVILILDDRPLEHKEYTVGVLFMVFFGVMAGAQNLGLTAPHLEAFNTACGAATGVFEIIDRCSAIDSLGKEGNILEDANGDVVFTDVHFQYPSRPDIQVLQGLNLTIRAGKTVALVGASGCGKSTCVQLLQRLYDPTRGQITIAGHDIADLNVKSLRSVIGVVGQEPVLFGTTIRENIRYGRPDCSQQDIEDAARNANCHDFIIGLPQGYDTMVGESGGQLSGGQKQRIAIARALVRRPTILLLDEATSALDTKSQALVQEALDKAAVGRTTIIVSHRLSTILNADEIIYIDHGQVVEKGTHWDLMEQKGFYFKLQQADTRSTAKDDNLEELEEASVYNVRGLSASKKSFSDSSNSRMSFTKMAYSKSLISEDGIVEGTKGQEKDGKVKKRSKERGGMVRLMRLNGPEWPLIVVGCLACVAVGATLPMFAIVFGDIYGILSLPDPEEVKRYATIYCSYFVGIGVITGIGTFVQTYVFTISGSKLTARLRSSTFSTMIRQEIGWYDKEKNSVGALGSRLAGDCSAVQGATGSRVGSILQTISTLFLGILLAFFMSWKLSLASIAIIPLVLSAVFLEGRYMSSEDVTEKMAMERSCSIATEAISNIRTVASLCQENAFEERYNKEIDSVSKSARTKTRLRGLIFSMGQTAPMLGYTVALSYGGVLIATKEMPYQNVVKVSESLIFGAWMLGQTLAFAPNINVAKSSAQRLFKLFDRETRIKSSPNCKDLKNWKANGDISYNKVKFSYPTRPGSLVLRGLHLDIGQGKNVALVGSSGCGKSTCIQLLQRLYDPLEGKITLDGMNITEDIAVDVLRSQLGLVSQEPVLFDKTIAQNISYGDNSREVTMAELMDAARSANIHNFIMGLPQGYETRLGTKGAQLSGGQKQRIAIARALIRNPRVLLLDEATSALDSESEKVVQKALEEAGAGRTCITIAHRLNTIKHADTICVLDKGQVIERGNHEQLMRLDGIYRQMYITEQPL